MKFSQSASHSLSKFWCLLTPVIVLLASAAFLSAQSSTSGDIAGTVTDPAGATVAGAVVQVVNTATGVKQNSATDSRGSFNVALLPPASYTVTVSTPGFRPIQKTVTVALGQVAQADFRLEVMSQTTTVEVESEVATVQTENADIQTTFSTKQIEELPNPGSDITFYAQLAPGSVMNTGGGYGNFSSFGLPGTSNLFTMNGQNDNDPFLNLNNSGASNLLLGANEISEVTVTTNGYSGQYGQLAGAAVNYLTKSGENQFHGNLRYLWDGRVMNANDFFNNANGIPRQFVNANQWADSIGGPILKNKLFFFVNNEGLEVLLPTGGSFVRLPSAQFQAATLANLNATGLGSEVPYIQQLFNAYNGASGISRATAVPLGSGDVSGPGCGTLTVLAAGTPCVTQYYSAPNAFAHEWQFAPRVDYAMNDKDRFFWRFQTDHGVQPTYTDPINPIFNASSIQPEDQGQFNWTHIFGPRATNQFIGSAIYYNAPFGPANVAATNAVFPSLAAFGDGSINTINATDSFSPQGREVTQFQFVDDVTLIAGKHTIKFGGNFHRDLVRDYDFGINTGGEVIFGSINDLYNGVLGENGFFAQNVPTADDQQIRTYQLGAYIQDDFKVTPRLKINLAFRVDHNSNPTCLDSCFATSYGSFASLDHDASIPYNQAILDGRRQAYLSTDAIMLEPRLGFAYSFNNSKSVIRGGAGIFGDSFPATVVDGFAENPPYYNSIGLPGAAGFATAPVSPATPGNIYSISQGASASINSGFANGGTLASLTAANPLFSTPNLVASDGIIHQPVYYEWNLEFQQSLGFGMILSLNYVGNHGIHEAIVNNGVNFFCPAGNCSAGSPLPSAPLDSRFNTVTDYQSSGTSNYNGLVVSLKKSLSKHVQFTFNYAWSHSLDDVSNGGLLPFVSGALLGPIDPQNIKAYNYGNSDYDVRNYVSSSYVIDDAIRAAGFHHGPNALFGGWSLGGTIFYRTGFPFSVTDSGGFTVGGASILATSTGSGRASCSAANVYTPNGTPCLTLADFAPSALTNAENGAVPIENGYGNQNRNQYRGPNMFDTDLNAYKSFTIHERFRFQVGAEFFNLFNHPNFANPSSNLDSPTFGQSSGTISVPTSILGSFLGGDASPRLIQLHAEVKF